MNSESSQFEERMNRERVDQVYHAHVGDLENFLLGVLRDASTAADALQATFVQLMEKGHTVVGDDYRSWLFRVAFNEAMQIKRRQTGRKRLVDKAAWTLNSSQQGKESVGVAKQLLDLESNRRVQAAVDSLPSDQKQIVKARIYDGLKFKEIAENLDIPLGTALTRMQAALKKLKSVLSQR